MVRDFDHLLNFKFNKNTILVLLAWYCIIPRGGGHRQPHGALAAGQRAEARPDAGARHRSLSTQTY